MKGEQMSRLACSEESASLREPVSSSHTRLSSKRSHESHCETQLPARDAPLGAREQPVVPNRLLRPAPIGADSIRNGSVSQK